MGLTKPQDLEAMKKLGIRVELIKTPKRVVKRATKKKAKKKTVKKKK